MLAVNGILYVLFTEGYLSNNPDMAVRRELCDEALRLAELLAAHPVGQAPDTFALIALMHLHVARLSARQNGSGGLLLLEEQDRSLWDRARVLVGLEWLAQSAHGTEFSRYHAEAGIAAEHCLATSFEATRWDRVVECYLLLERDADSPIHTLNRAVAVAEWKGPAAGLAVLASLGPPTWLLTSSLWAAVMADLHGRVGNSDVAERYCTAALAAAPTRSVEQLLRRRLCIKDGDGTHSA